MVEVNTSPKASVPAALRADELILLPKSLLNFESHILNPMDINKSIKGTISNVTASGFNILEKEIEIINPDIVLFLTGDYDRYIEKQLDGVKFHELENSECYIARVEHKVLDKRISFRTYQPDYFRFLKKGMYDKCIQELVKECGL